MNLLIVEDDENMSNGLKMSLAKEYEKIYLANSCKEGRNIITNKRIDIVILDCNLPDGDGYSLCKEIKGMVDIPVLMVTARDTELDEIKGFDVGADDYISKPFSLAVLAVRMHCAQKKYCSPKALFSKDIKLYIEEHKLYKGDLLIALTPIEWKMIYCLMCNAGCVVSKNKLLEYIWETDGDFVDENTIPVNIRRIRIKIEDDPSKPEYIKVVRGFGYRWSEETKEISE